MSLGSIQYITMRMCQTLHCYVHCFAVNVDPTWSSTGQKGPNQIIIKKCQLNVDIYYLFVLHTYIHIYIYIYTYTYIQEGIITFQLLKMDAFSHTNKRPKICSLLIYLLSFFFHCLSSTPFQILTRLPEGKILTYSAIRLLSQSPLINNNHCSFEYEHQQLNCILKRG